MISTSLSIGRLLYDLIATEATATVEAMAEQRVLVASTIATIEMTIERRVRVAALSVAAMIMAA
jgi:hypothetical protein